MKTFGQNIEIQNIIKEDKFYLEPNEFKSFIKYVLYQYTIGNNNSFKLIYNPKSGEISKLSKNFERDYINNILNIENIHFDNYGCVFEEHSGEKAIVSPEFFMLQLLENLKRNPEQIYAFFKGMENEFGKEHIGNINFAKIKEKLEEKYRKKQTETQGLYKLT